MLTANLVASTGSGLFLGTTSGGFGGSRSTASVVDDGGLGFGLGTNGVPAEGFKILELAEFCSVRTGTWMASLAVGLESTLMSSNLS